MSETKSKRRFVDIALQQQQQRHKQQHERKHERQQERRSQVVRVNETRRRAHLAAVLPTGIVLDPNATLPNSTLPMLHLDSFAIYVQVSTWLGWYHLTAEGKHGMLLPEVQERLSRCDIDFSLEFMESMLSEAVAARELSIAMNAILPNSTLQRPQLSDLQPIGLIGATRSFVSMTVSILASAYGLPMISPASTSKELDNKGVYPLFARTVPTNVGEATAIVQYLMDLQVSHFAVLYVTDSFGTGYAADVVQKATALGIDVRGFSYKSDSHISDPTIETALLQLKASGLRYVVAILGIETQKMVFQKAYDLGLMGIPGFTWILTEGSINILTENFILDRANEGEIAQAIHGTGLVTLEVPTNDAFDNALTQFSRPDSQKEDFLQKHAYPQQLRDYYEWPLPSFISPNNFAYDAVMTYAIAACECKTDIFDGNELYQQILNTSFEGVSGKVSFDRETGTRNAQNFKFRLFNILISEDRSSQDIIRLTPQLAAKVDIATGSINRFTPFVYADGTTSQPAELPPIEIGLNLIPKEFRLIGFVLASLTIIYSIGWTVWTFRHRNSDVVKASQPLFLCQLCLGTTIMAFSIFPMSLQEPVEEVFLDISCMLTPCLLVVGFTICITALMSKTWRLNKILQNGLQMRRIKVRVQDALLPLLVLMTVNIILLSTWTAISPLKWERTELDSFDEYGRSLESYGQCSFDSQVHFLCFAIPLFLCNVSAILAAGFQYYKARHVSTDFSETRFIGMAMASMVETLIIGAPLLLVTKIPTHQYLIRVVLVVFCCIAILSFIFIPKYFACRDGKKNGAQGSLKPFQQVSSKIYKTAATAVTPPLNAFGETSSEPLRSNNPGETRVTRH